MPPPGFEGLGMASHDEPERRFCCVPGFAALQALQRLAVEFIAGAATVTPQPGACDYCDLASLCRINELSISADPEALGGPA